LTGKRENMIGKKALPNVTKAGGLMWVSTVWWGERILWKPGYLKGTKEEMKKG